MIENVKETAIKRAKATEQSVTSSSIFFFARFFHETHLMFCSIQNQHCYYCRWLLEECVDCCGCCSYARWCEYIAVYMYKYDRETKREWNKSNIKYIMHFEFGGKEKAKEIELYIIYEYIL